MTTRTSTLSIGENRGKPRIWIEGKYLGANGFAKGQQVKTTWMNGIVTIEAVEDGGDHKVAERRGRQVLDYNCAAIGKVFDNADKVTVSTSAGRIVITPSRSEAKRITRTATDNKTAGSIFSGGGMLDEAVRQAGYTTTFGVEWNDKYADVWQENHSGHLYQGCISEVPLRALPQVELFTGGIPCEPFSRARRQVGNKKRTVGGYVDHDLADMTFWALQVIDACNPRTVVLEEVEDYVTSELGCIAIKVLQRMGYNVDWRVVAGTEYGALCVRKRAIIVAVSEGEVNWPAPTSASRTMADILLPHDHADCEWFTRSDKEWLWNHWEKQTAKGNGFVSQQVTADTSHVQAITKRYFAGQGDNPVVAHPTKPDTFRWFTIDEVKAIMGLPQSYKLGEAKTTAGEIMGQGVLVDVFRQVIESVTRQRKSAVAA